MEDLEEIRAAAWRAISPLKLPDAATKANQNFLFTAVRTNAGGQLPAYHLVYFLLVELLGFRNLGQWEKTSWSVPADLDGIAYLIEHRKFGIGVFANKTEDSEQKAQRIVDLIKSGVKAARPFYEWQAQLAIQKSRINISNVSRDLYERYKYFTEASKLAQIELDAIKATQQAEKKQRELFPFQTFSYDPKLEATINLVDHLTLPWLRQQRRPGWLALAAIDAFFAWTEHVFIHLAILQGRITTGPEVAKLTGAEWGEKFKAALDINEKEDKDHYDRLRTIRRQLRNFMAHGAFGKSGETFSFHSGAGAVPVVYGGLESARWSLAPEREFDDAQALAAIDEFIGFLWSGNRTAARIYIEQSNLPTVLPLASDGTYAAAMASIEDMEQFVDHEMRRWDDAANMDW
jgi:hypothetical protein